MNHPRLRPGLAAAPDGNPGFVYLFDELRIAREPLKLTKLELNWTCLLNGRRSPRDIQSEAMRQAGGLLIPLERIEALIRQLDEGLYLDNERFSDYVFDPVREPVCLGSYSAEPDELREQLACLFTAEGGPGLPGEPGSRVLMDGPMRALLVPHIDYGRGGITYGWGFKELVERTEASLFVIIATSHYSGERFTLTRKNFLSPFGLVPTDQQYIDRLEAHYGDGLFNDPIAHLPEHSIELEVVLLQYLLEGKRPFRIVPLLVGSYADCIHNERPPGTCDDVSRMVEALRQVEHELDEPICYIISGDLAHIGPKFDDPAPLDESFLEESLRQDQALLKAAEQVNVASYFETIAAEQDRRRICGLPPTWLTLSAVSPSNGRLLHYGRYVHPEGFESVSFASMAFSH